MPVNIEPLTAAEDVEWCARVMSASEPCITLGRAYRACHSVLNNPSKECYLIRQGRERAGLLILDMNGPFPGYIQSVCLAAEARGRGIGSEAIRWAEERIFRASPNVFICVSSFNPEAQRLYERLGFEHVGVLHQLIVPGHDERLLRKTRGPWTEFQRT